MTERAQSFEVRVQHALLGWHFLELAASKTKTIRFTWNREMAVPLPSPKRLPFNRIALMSTIEPALLYHCHGPYCQCVNDPTHPRRIFLPLAPPSPSRPVRTTASFSLCSLTKNPLALKASDLEFPPASRSLPLTSH